MSMMAMIRNAYSKPATRLQDALIKHLGLEKW